MATTYTYSLANDFPGGAMNSDKLVDEIQSSSIITALDYIQRSSDVVDIVFKAALSTGDKTTLDGDTTTPAGGLIATHDNTKTELISSVFVKEEITPDGNAPTGGNFRATTRKIYTTPNSTSTTDTTYPYPIVAFALHFIPKPENEGDVINMYVSPDTIIGTITSDVSTSDTVINVDQTVINIAEIGYMVDLYTPPSTVDTLGEISNINKLAKTITVTSAATLAAAASPTTYVRISIIYLEDYTINTPNVPYTIGESKIGGSYVPTNTTIRVTYQNKAPVKRKLGTITAACNASSTNMTVDQDAIDNISRGDRIELDDSTNVDALGEVVEIDNVDKIIYFETTTTNTFSSGTVIKTTSKKFVPDVELLY
jgi:hypothetical protein